MMAGKCFGGVMYMGRRSGDGVTLPLIYLTNGK
jgi:hypothetical protein